MLYENLLHTLAEDMGTDLYILPSSVHEVIAISAELGDPKELTQMVAEINMSTVCLEERLSNQVYHYDKDLRKLSLATDTPYKRLEEEKIRLGILSPENPALPKLIPIGIGIVNLFRNHLITNVFVSIKSGREGNASF